MYYYEEMSVKEIAASMNATENAVKSRLLYGRRKIEKKVRELEKNGTKLYGLAPIPFLLWLLRGQKAYAAELPDAGIRQNILKSLSSSSSATPKETVHAAKHSAAHAAKAAGTTKTAAAAGAGFSGVKLAVAAVIGAAVIGGSVFSITRPGKTSEQPMLSVSTSQSSHKKEPFVNRSDTDNGYRLTYHNEEHQVVRESEYLKDGTLTQEYTNQYDELGRVVKHTTYRFYYEYEDRISLEAQRNYHYSPGDTHVTIEWQQTEKMNDSETYTASEQFSYEMQKPDNEIRFELSSWSYDQDTWSIVLHGYSVLEKESGVWLPAREFDISAEEKIENPSSETTEGSGQQNNQTYSEAFEHYHTVIANAANYDFGEYAYPNGDYLYALEYMHTGDPVPTLLLCQLGDDYIDHVRVFYYDVDSKTILAPEEVITTGVAQTGGFRGGLSMMGDGNGLQISEVGGMRGDIYISRAIRSENNLEITQEWSGFLDDNNPYGDNAREITWYELSDETGFRKTDKDVEISDIATDSAPAEQDEAALWIEAEEAAGRTILTGTVDTITYDEAVELQGYPDYNAADKGQTWVLIRLDNPQLLKGTQDVITWEKEHSVVMVWTRQSSGLEYGESILSGFTGEHIICSVGSFSKASDTSMPLGMPWAHDIHIWRNEKTRADNE